METGTNSGGSGCERRGLIDTVIGKKGTIVDVELYYHLGLARKAASSCPNVTSLRTISNVKQALNFLTKT